MKNLTITNNGKFSFTVKVKTKYHSDKITSLSNVKNVPCKIDVHPNLDSSKSLIFLTEFNIDDLDPFKADLKVN